MALDTSIVFLAIALVGLASLGLDPGNIGWRLDISFSFNYYVFGAALGASWLWLLGAFDSRDPKILGGGATEFRRVVDSTLTLTLVAGLIMYATQLDVNRRLFFGSIALGLTLLLAGRLLARTSLTSARRRGAKLTPAVLIGNGSAIAEISRTLKDHPEIGYKPVSAHVTDDQFADVDLPRASAHLSDFSDLGLSDHDDPIAVILVGGHSLDHKSVTDLSWQIADRHELILVPSLLDIAGPRIHATPVAGMTMVHVDSPRYEGANRFMKRAFDLIGSATLLILLLPLLACIAIAIKMTSSGPVIFKQERIGKNGGPFPISKFRSMTDGADNQLHDLLSSQDRAGRPLFKIANDPRVTKVGLFLRRTSLDELPQLWNVLKGDMSLVGPRPQVPKEVALYDRRAFRRLAVRPGITGLWQVSGRSKLSWDDALKLDLYYVENWSVVQDATILARTVKAVLTNDGAQ